MDKNVVRSRMFDCLGIDRNKPSATFISEIKAQDKCWSKMPSCHLESSSIPQVISISRVVAHFTSNCGNPEALGGRNISWPESDHFLTNLF